MKWRGLSSLQRRILLLSGGVVLGAYGIWHLFGVSKVEVQAPGRQVEIRTETERIIKDKWRQRNLLTINDGELVSDLQQGDPLLKSVEVRRKWFHSIVVKATLKQPSMGWTSGNQRYLLDRDGTAIGVLAADSKLPVVVDGSNLPVQMGARVAPARLVAFVTALVPALAAEGYSVTGLEVKDTTLDLNVTTDKGYQLVFDTGRTVGEEIYDLRAVKGLLATQKKTPAEYIDLRIAGKAYYK
jgi:cell division septal protein FtsQ